MSYIQYLKEELESSDLSIGWGKPVLKDEAKEYFENHLVRDYFEKNGIEFDSEKKLQSILRKGKLQEVNRMELSDNYTNMGLLQSEFERKLMNPQYEQSFVQMEEELLKNKKMKLPAPILIKMGDLYYGYSGNKRMNLAWKYNLPVNFWVVNIKPKTIINTTGEIF